MMSEAPLSKLIENANARALPKSLDVILWLLESQRSGKPGTALGRTDRDVNLDHVPVVCHQP